MEDYEIKLNVEDYVNKHSTNKPVEKANLEFSSSTQWAHKNNVHKLAFDLPEDIINEFKQLCLDNNSTQAQMFKALLEYWKS